MSDAQNRPSRPSAPRARRLLSTVALLALAGASPMGAALLVAAPEARAEGQVADVKLPWNPLEGAAPGDWAFYQVRDPDRPDERLPGERYLINSIEGGFANLIDSKNDLARYPVGDAGVSALGWLGGFFGELRKGMLSDITALATTPDACTVGDRRYEGVRIDITLAVKMGEAGTPPTPASFQLWLVKGLHGSGLVRADAAVTINGVTHRGILELEAHGTKNDKMPSRNPSDPQNATKTAAPAAPVAPAAATGTAAPGK